MCNCCRVLAIHDRTRYTLLSDPERLALLCMKVLLVEEEEGGDDKDEDLESNTVLLVISPSRPSLWTSLLTLNMPLLCQCKRPNALFC